VNSCMRVFNQIVWGADVRNSLFALSLVTLCLAPNVSAHAAGNCYKAEPVKGPDGKPIAKLIEPVCRALEKNLNEFCDEPPLVCSLKIHPKYRRTLALPKWETVELDGGMALVEEFIRAPWKTAHDQQASQRIWDDERPGLEAAFQEGKLRVATSHLDLYQTGKPDKVYMLDLSSDCEQKNSHLTSNDRSEWAGEFESPKRRVYYAPETIHSLERHFQSLFLTGLYGEIFLFRGKTFTYSIASYWPRYDSQRRVPVIGVFVDQGYHLMHDGETISYRNVCQLDYQLGRSKP
jgi:hypothetical protein